jgi:two-component system chemotaxis response regulator CheY
MKTIMIVDDSSTMRSLVKMMLLRIPGVVVVEAVNGKDALVKLRVGTPALLVTDINMPEMDGLQLVEEVRKTKSKAELPIIIVSTKGEEADIAKGLGLGANDYLPKPINGLDLASKVKMLMESAARPMDSRKVAYATTR